MKITFFFRKRQPSYNSIEEVFSTLIPIISQSHLTIQLTAPFKSSFFGVIFNWLFFLYRKSDIIHITGDVHYLAILKKSPIIIITVHDLQSIFRSKGRVDKLKKWLWVSGPLKRASHIVAISENTQNEINDMLPEVSHKTSVIPNPISPIFKFAPKPIQSERPIILHVGTAPHKNLDRVIEAVSVLNVRLHILGVLSPTQIIQLKNNSLRYESYSKLPYEQVYQLYLQADIVSFPSAYEGFGMPIIESQAVGRPLLTSNLPSIKRIAGAGGALFVDTSQMENIRNGFEELLNNPVLRASLVDSGKINIERYQAHQIAKQYLDLYKSVIDKS